MGMAGVPFPWHVTLIEPGSAFNLDYAVNSLAMPMIGGTTTWLGPLVGAVLLGTAQQIGDRDHLLGIEPADCRGCPGGLCHPGARRHCRARAAARQREHA